MNENEEAKRLGALHIYSYSVKEADGCFFDHLWAGNERNLEILALKIKLVFVFFFSKNLDFNQTTL